MNKIILNTLSSILLVLSIYYTSLLFICTERNLTILLSLLIILTLSIGLYKNKITSPTNLLLLTSILFLSSRPLLSLIYPDKFNYKIADWFIYGEQLDNNIISANLMLISMILGYLLCFLIFKKDRKEIPPSVVIINKNIKIILAFVYILGSFSIITTGLHNWYIVQNQGYLSIYSSYAPPPFYLNKLTYLFYMGFFLTCALIPKYRQNKIFLLISILICLFTILKGSRGEFITFFLTIISIYFSEKKIKNISLIFKMVFIFLLLFLVSEIISMWRSNGDFVNLMSEHGNPIVNFTYGIGVSYLALTQAAEIAASNILPSISSYYFLFSQPILTASAVLNLDIDTTLISYSHFVSNYSNTIQYSEGAGLGGSYLSEAYLLGGFTACLIFSFLLMSIANYGYLKAKTDWKVFYLFYSSLPSLLFIPRETYFYYIPFIIKGAFVIVIFGLLIKKDCHEKSGS